MVYRRVLIKLSGEALSGEDGYGISFSKIDNIIEEINELIKRRIELGIVIGGGNFWRGRNTKDEKKHLSSAVSDIVGMLATVINGVILKEKFIKCGISAEIFSKINIEGLTPTNANPIDIDRYIKSGGVAIFVGGTGNPCVTTDTAAAIRAVEIQAQVLLKATKVDGVYPSDPKVAKNKKMKMFRRINIDDVINQKLGVMDIAALSICKENKIPIIVFNFFKKGNLLRVIEKCDIGTYIYI